MKCPIRLLSGVLLLAVLSCTSPDQNHNSENELSIKYEKYELENGLDIILHEDKSDPIVAIAVEIHAGSNREKPGRTGFAHFFEHMLFKKSENVPEGYFWDKIPEWGGTFNGTTNKDRTLYFETIPKNALEKLLWMEADRLGYFINAVDPKGFETEKQVVKNEKRYRVDNNPYGHRNYTIIKAMYPETHPYNWTTIGEFEDLQNATLEDVKEFYDQWYGPQNATLVIAGDFDKEQTKKWIEKYFGEIKPHGEEVRVEPKPIQLSSSKLLFHEDNFAKLPQLTLNFPTVEIYHKDYWAINTLAEILTDGKSSPLYKQLVLTDKLTPGVSAYHFAQEMAGNLRILVNANEGVDLDEVRSSIDKAFRQFETDGVSEVALNRVKTNLERQFYEAIESVQDKSFQLAHYNTFKGNPGFIETDIKNIQNVTAEEVYQAYENYIAGKNLVATSFVPKGHPELALEGSERAFVKEETQEPYQLKDLPESNMGYQKTPSTFDRTIEPDFGPDLEVTAPTIWSRKLGNGMEVYGIRSDELPLVSFSIRLKGGKQLDHPDKVGVANLIADVMMEGTQSKTPEQLENAIRDLGAEIYMSADHEYITINASCLSKNYEQAIGLVTEILLEPRWDLAEFERIKKETLTAIKQRDADAGSVVAMVRNKILYRGNIMAYHPLGTEISLSKISIDDLKGYYDSFFVPNVSAFHISGNIDENRALASLTDLSEKWSFKEIEMPEVKLASLSDQRFFFVDIPESKQSQLNMMSVTVDGNDDSYLPISIANYQLGAGSHGYLNKKLRIEKGYTYGSASFPIKRISKSHLLGFAAVKSNVTKESIEAFNEVVQSYRDNYASKDLEITKNSLLRETARDYETLDDLLGILHQISTYNLPHDFIEQNQKVIKNISMEEVRALIKEYIDTKKMIYLVVGDKATQYDRLLDMGMGKPIELDMYGDYIIE